MNKHIPAKSIIYIALLCTSIIITPSNSELPSFDQSTQTIRAAQARIIALAKSSQPISKAQEQDGRDLMHEAFTGFVNYYKHLRNTSLRLADRPLTQNEHCEVERYLYAHNEELKTLQQYLKLTSNAYQQLRAKIDQQNDEKRVAIQHAQREKELCDLNSYVVHSHILGQDIRISQPLQPTTPPVAPESATPEIQQLIPRPPSSSLKGRTRRMVQATRDDLIPSISIEPATPPAPQAQAASTSNYVSRLRQLRQLSSQD